MCTNSILKKQIDGLEFAVSVSSKARLLDLTDHPNHFDITEECKHLFIYLFVIYCQISNIGGNNLAIKNGKLTM